MQLSAAAFQFQQVTNECTGRLNNCCITNHTCGRSLEQNLGFGLALIFTLDANPPRPHRDLHLFVLRSSFTPEPNLAPDYRPGAVGTARSHKLRKHDERLRPRMNPVPFAGQPERPDGTSRDSC